jgi:hypothetical protein
MESWTDPSPLGVGAAGRTGAATGRATTNGAAEGDGVTVAMGADVLLGIDHKGVGSRVVGLQVPDDIGDDVTGVVGDTGEAETGAGGEVAMVHCEQSPKTTKVRLVTVSFNFKQV